MCLFQDYSNLDSFSLVEVLDLIESTRETVDDVWKQNEHAPYPEPRMIRLMDVIGAHNTHGCKAVMMLGLIIYLIKY